MSMRILLVHNPKAGSDKYAAEKLMTMLKEAGHRPVYQSSKKRNLNEALRKKFDLLLVAAGDGTVAKVARRLVKSRRKMPISVLPLGKANNVARTLGFDVSTEAIIAGLTKGKGGSFDVVGVARGPWGKRYFFESAGAGLPACRLPQCAPERKSESNKVKSASVTTASD